MDGLSHWIRDSTHNVGHGPAGDIVKGSCWCCNTPGLPRNVLMELR